MTAQVLHHSCVTLSNLMLVRLHACVNKHTIHREPKSCISLLHSSNMFVLFLIRPLEESAETTVTDTDIIAIKLSLLHTSVKRTID